MPLPRAKFGGTTFRARIQILQRPPCQGSGMVRTEQAKVAPEGRLVDLRFVVSLTNDDNDYQIEQAASAQAAARRLGAEVKSPREERCDRAKPADSKSGSVIVTGRSSIAIVVEPVGNATPQAHGLPLALASLGLLNRDADYLRGCASHRKYPSRHQFQSRESTHPGRQFRRAAARRRHRSLQFKVPPETLRPGRTSGMLETKPAKHPHENAARNWTEEAHRRLSVLAPPLTSKDDSIDIVGARRFHGHRSRKRSRMINRRVGPAGTACSSLAATDFPKPAQTWVRNNILKATVVVPANYWPRPGDGGEAIGTGVNPPETAFTDVSSYPASKRWARQKEVTSPRASVTNSSRD